MATKTYREVLERYDRAKAFGEKRTLPEYAAHLNEIYDTQDFSAGQRDGAWTRFSTRADQNVFEPVAAATTEPLFAGLGAMFGEEDAGRMVGRGLPRALAQGIPLIAAEVLSGGAATPAIAAAYMGGGALATGAAFGGQTYADTGNAKAAVISGAANAAMPGVGRLAGGIAGRLAGGVGARIPGQAFADVFGSEAAGTVGKVAAAKFAGSQAGMYGLNVGSTVAQSRAQGQDMSWGEAALSPEALLGQIPFTVFDIVGYARAPHVGIETVKALQPGKVETPAAPFVPPAGSEAARATAEALATRAREIELDPVSTPEMKATAFQQLYASVMTPEQTESVKMAQKLGGTTDEPTITLRGKADKISNGNYRVLVEGHNSIEHGPEMGVTVFVNGAEPNADGTFTVKKSQIKPAEYALAPDPQVDPSQPELQPRPEGVNATTTQGLQQVPFVEEALKLSPIAENNVTLRRGEDLVEPSIPEQSPEDLELNGPRDLSERGRWFARDISGPAGYAKRGRVLEITMPKIEAEKYRVGEDGFLLPKELADIARQQWENKRPRINEADATGLVAMGVPVDRVAVGVVDSQGLKEAVMRYEQTQQQARTSKTAIEAVPTKAEEWAGLVPAENVKVVEGATPTQSVESARLSVHTPELDRATQEMVVLQEEVQERTQSETSRGQQQNQYDPVLGPTGEPAGGFLSRAEALEWIEDAGLGDDKSIVIRNAGRYEDGRQRPYNIVRVINRGMSLDAPTETGGTAHEVIADTQAGQDIVENTISDAAEAFTPEERPEVSRQTLLQNLDLASRSPSVFARATGLDVPDSLRVIRQARTVLPELDSRRLSPSDFDGINEHLVKSGLPEFTDMGEMLETFTLARSGADAFDGKKAWSMGSSLPDDEALVQEIGIRESVSKALSWWAGQPDNSVMGSLTQDLLRALPNLDLDVDIMLPGSLGHDQRKGWMYWTEDGVRSKINVKELPVNKEDAFLWGLKLAHEVAHYATKELSSRGDEVAVNFRKTLDEVRAAITAKLDPKLRAFVAKVQKEDHVGKFARGEWTAEQLAEKWKAHKDNFELIYGLSNNDEFVSQIFGSPEIVAYANNTRMPKGVIGTAMDFFVRSWNKLVGRQSDDMALAQVLKSLDEYLAPAAFRDGYNGKDYIRDTLLSTGVRDTALASRMKSVQDLVNTGNIAHSLSGFQREGDAGTLPVTAQYGPLPQNLRTSLLLGEAKDVHKSGMGLYVDDLPVAQELWYRMREDVNLAKQTHAEIRGGQLPGSVSKEAVRQLAAAEQKVQMLGLALKKQANAVERLQQITQLSPEGWQTALSDQLFGGKKALPTGIADEESLRAKVALERLEGKGGMSWFARTFGLTQHVAASYPSVKPAVQHVSEEQGQAHSRASALNIALHLDPNMVNADGSRGGISKDSIKTFARVRENESLSQAASDIFRWVNREGKATTLDLNDPFVRDTLGRFNEKDRKDILHVISANAQRQQVWAGRILPQAMGRLNQEYTAQLIGARDGMMPEVSRQVSAELYSGLEKLVNPETSAIGAQELGVLQTKMSPDTYLRALQHAQTLSQKTAAWIKQAADRPGYVSEQRYGKDQLVMVGPKGEKFRTSGERDGLNKVRQQKEGQGYKLVDYVAAEDANAPRMGLREDMLKGLEELDEQKKQMAVAFLGDKPDVLANVLPMIGSAQSLRESIQAAAPLPRVKRNFVEGREYINMLDNADQFYVRMNNWLRNRLVVATTNVDLMHPEVQANPELRKYVQQHVENFLTPDNPTARKVVEATYFYKLAFDLGNSLLEGTQNLTTGMAGLIGETGSVGEAFSLWGKAVKTIAQKHATGKWNDPEHHWLMEKLKEVGAGGVASWSDIVDPDSTAVFDANAGKVGGAVGLVKNAAKSWTAGVSKYNDWIAALAAYDLSRSRGEAQDAALAFAIDVKNRGLFTGGKSQRPVGLWSIKTRPVPQLLGALQNYSLGWFGQMAENYKKGFGAAPAGLTDTQRLGAKKAFVYSLAAQAALAGVLGLPGVGQGLALLNQATGLDLKGKMLANLQQMFDEDQEGGGTLTGLAMRGIGAYGLPFDPSGRASVSVPFLGVDSYKGFDVANLGGAATSTVGDFVTGILGMAKGDATAGAKLLPNVLKRPFQLLQGEGDVRDQRGTLIAELSPAERFLMASGLTPSRVQAARDTSEAVKKANLVAQRQKESFVDNLATLARKGNTQEVQLQLVQYLKEHPGESYKSLAQSVASRVTAQTVPYDWRRDVNPGADIAGLSSPAPSTELLRRNVSQGVSQSLGVSPRSNPRQDYVAQQLDWLMDSTGMSRPQAMAQLGQGTRRVQRPSILPNIPGLQ